MKVNVSRTKALLKREIMDILRDKKTLVMMLAVPLLLYPLLIVGMTALMSAMITSQEAKTYTIATNVSEKAQSAFEEIAEKNQDKVGYKLQIEQAETGKDSLDKGGADIYLEEQEDGNFEVYYQSAEDNSSTAYSAVEKMLDIYGEKEKEKNIADAGLEKKKFLNPITYIAQDISSTEESIGNMIGSVLPFFIITSILLGALYPAIDVTAGEKERGTLETLLTLPVTNLEMITSKFLAVSLIAVVSAFLNVISMGGAMVFMVTSSFATMANMDLTIRYSSFIPGILFMMVVMIFFALFVTACCMCTCIFAKSFKEANNYSTPVMLVFMFGSYAAMIPDLELTKQTAAIPIVNIALLVEQLFKFQYNYGLFAIVLLSTVLYSVLAVMILSKLYNSEAILFADGFTSINLFTKRSEIKKGQIPGIGDCVLMLAFVLWSMIYFGTYAQLKWGFAGVVVTQASILVIPLIYLWYIKADFKKVLSLKMPRVTSLLGSLILWLATYCLMILLSVFLQQIFPESAKNVTDTFGEFMNKPTIVLALVMALMPAIGEECMFRGFLFGSLREKLKPMTAIIVVSCIFGIYHMSLIKFFTTSILGLSFALAAYYSGSIGCSMLMHFCNNFLSVLLMKEGNKIAELFPFLVTDKLQLSDILLLLAITLLAGSLGIWLLKRPGKPQAIALQEENKKE